MSHNMTFTRREFLGCGLAGLSYVALGAAIPRTFARAAEAAHAAGKNNRVLVVVELAGGNDGLNTLIPFEDDLYYKNRKTLAIAKDSVLKLGDRVGLHPALGPVEELYKQGRIALVQGVGYPQPDRSHFRSMEIWHTASIEKRPPTTGWLGRAVDALPGSGDESAFCGCALTGSLPQAFQADRVVVPVVHELDQFAGEQQSPQVETQLRRSLSTVSGKGASPVQFLRQQSAAVYRTADRLKEATAKYQSTTAYPESGLGGQLKRAAQILSGGLGVRVLFVSQEGYDTHSGQAEPHAALLADLAACLAAFDKDLQLLGLANTVAVLTFSEFGRRVDENASGGTDHGAASCLLLHGAAIKGGLHGEYPTLAKLGEGDLIYKTDFRHVYAGVLEDWLGCPASKILGQEFPKLALFQKTA